VVVVVMMKFQLICMGVDILNSICILNNSTESVKVMEATSSSD